MAFRNEIGLIGLLIGLPFIGLAIGILGKPGQFARSLRAFEGRPVQVEIWGVPLPGSEGCLFKVDSLACLGVGLWIYLRPLSGGRRTKLKIAQPTSMLLNNGVAKIDFSGYAQWAGRWVRNSNGQRRSGTVVLTFA